MWALSEGKTVGVVEILERKTGWVQFKLEMFLHAFT